MQKNCCMGYGHSGGQRRKSYASWATTAVRPGRQSQCALVVSPMPMSCMVVPHIPATPTWGTRCCPYPWERVTTLRAWGSVTATCNVRKVLTPEWCAVHPSCGREWSSTSSCYQDRPARARGRIILETCQTFTIVLVYLSEPYQKTGFVILCRRITSSVMADFLNKFFFYYLSTRILHGSKWLWHL